MQNIRSMTEKKSLHLWLYW